MFKTVHSVDELVQVYKFLSDVPNTNLPKIKKFIRRLVKHGIVYVAYEKKKMIACIVFDIREKYVSLPNLYVDKKFRFKHVVLKDLLDSIRYIQQKYSDKHVYTMSDNINEYKHFVIPVRDNIYRVKDL